MRDLDPYRSLAVFEEMMGPLPWLIATVTLSGISDAGGPVDGPRVGIWGVGVLGAFVLA